MPRGQTKSTGVRAGLLGPVPGRGVALALAAPTEEETRSAIRKEVAAFARAWSRGDAEGMSRCLHPDFINRLMGIRSGGEEGAGGDPAKVVRSVVGLQAHFGAKSQRSMAGAEVRVLDVRSQSASAVAVLGGWVLHVHLARAGRRWSIVNAMWELLYASSS